MSQQEIQPDDPHQPAQISMWWLAVPLLCLVLAMVALRPNPNGPFGKDSPAVGKPAPRLDLVRLTDQPTLDRVESLAQGKVTLLHFWGTWCGPCKMEFPQLAAMANRMKSSPGFHFLAVSCESGGSETFEGLRKKTGGYFESQGIDSLAFADPQGITRRSAAERLERNSMFYPTSLVIGSDGRIAGVWEGYTPEAVEQMESLIGRLLEQTAVEI